jgi:predicted HicB family RNase H-like nuclease
MVVVNNFSYTKTMSAKMGRPKVPKGKQKIPFPIRFTRDNVAAFKRAARAAKMPVNEWVTSALTKAAKPT